MLIHVDNDHLNREEDEMKRIKPKHKPIGPPEPKEPGRNITKFLWKPLVINEEERWLETATYREIWKSWAYVSWYEKIRWIGPNCRRCGNDNTIEYRTKTWYGLAFGTKYLKCRNCFVKYAIPKNRTDKVIYEYDINKINPAPLGNGEMNRVKIVEIVNAVKPGETTEIPHYDLMLAMYDGNADAVDGTIGYSREYANKIAEECGGVTIGFSFCSNTWIVRSTIPVGG